MPDIVQILRRHAAAYLRRFGSRMPPPQRRALDDMLRCGTGALGGKLFVCRDCGHPQYVLFRCRNRACPVCHGKETVQWLASRVAELLPVRYFHVVFTLPSQLRALSWRYRRIALSLLMRSAADSLLELAADPHYCGGKIGILAVLHTWTRGLLWHPHVHCLVPAVAVAPDRSWHRTNPEYLVPWRALSDLFRGKFLDRLARALPGVGLPSGLCRHRWVSFCRPCREGPGNALAYVGRYVFGGPMRGKRISELPDGRYLLEYRDGDDGRPRTIRLHPTELIRRFLQHAPEPGFHRIRYYGLWARSNRSVLRSLQLALGPGLPAVVETFIAAAETLAATPLFCEQCGSTSLQLLARWRRFDPIPDIRAPPCRDDLLCA